MAFIILYVLGNWLASQYAPPFSLNADVGNKLTPAETLDGSAEHVLPTLQSTGPLPGLKPALLCCYCSDAHLYAVRPAKDVEASALLPLSQQTGHGS